MAGDFWIECALWLCFLLPGLCYRAWRLTNRAKVCSCCESRDIIPADSPRGIALQRGLMADAVLARCTYCSVLLPPGEMRCASCGRKLAA